MATHTVRMARTGDLLWLWWFFTGVAGFVGGMTIKTIIEILAEIGGFTPVLEAIPPALFGALLGAMLGVSTGFVQWLVLRRRLTNIGAWLPVTLATLSLFWFLHNAEVFGFAHTRWGLVLQGFGHGAIVGAMLGTAQYLALRSHVPNARRWIVISTISWSVAGAIMHLLLSVIFAASGVRGPFDILISSSLAALFSGFGLQRLLAEAYDR